MTTYLTADTHFCHGTMLSADGPHRPFANVDEMNDALIENWNAVVNPEDVVWHLGDLFMRGDDRTVAKIFYALKGRKRLIIGNHDVDKHGRLLPVLARLPWDAEPAHAAEIQHDGNRIMLSHYAGWTWNQAHRGAYLAFGHSPGGLLGLPGSIDVGVDVQKFKPISGADFVEQAEETILDAETRLIHNARRLDGLLKAYEDQADVIRKKRGEERTRGFRR